MVPFALTLPSALVSVIVDQDRTIDLCLRHHNVLEGTIAVKVRTDSHHQTIGGNGGFNLRSDGLRPMHLACDEIAEFTRFGIIGDSRDACPGQVNSGCFDLIDRAAAVDIREVVRVIASALLTIVVLETSLPVSSVSLVTLR